MTIAITMGDSSGVGPEIILHAFKKGELPEDFFVVGDYSILDVCNRMLNYEVPLRKSVDVGDVEKGYVNVLDLGLLREDDLSIGRISKASGHAALKYVERATQLALEGKVSAEVTLPMNKEATRLSEEGFSGHTGYIAQLCGQDKYTLMLASEKLIVTHVSTHVSLREAIECVKKDQVYDVIKLTSGILPKLRATSRIAVAGLNPHAGENGAFGNEDQDEIRPAVERARAEGLEVFGPFPPDTIFMDALKGRYDAIVCMYHDQGHIPMKVLDFEGGINVTLGLPIIRTSVDHGTAFDIAYKGVAFTASLRDACKLAVILGQG
ncbi:MAG: 4-hydroxythreonine-4-phosphate dehydrogenase PdxA [Pyrinomonadaceae bacterium]|nr:4-hydroxythreonine-4-phosphate dehydrogenase PdxA [Pyrinomonadaceae bacterium]